MEQISPVWPKVKSLLDKSRYVGKPYYDTAPTMLQVEAAKENLSRRAFPALLSSIFCFMSLYE